MGRFIVGDDCYLRVKYDVAFINILFIPISSFVSKQYQMLEKHKHMHRKETPHFTDSAQSVLFICPANDVVLVCIIPELWEGPWARLEGPRAGPGSHTNGRPLFPLPCVPQTDLPGHPFVLLWLDDVPGLPWPQGTSLWFRTILEHLWTNNSATQSVSASGDLLL